MTAKENIRYSRQVLFWPNGEQDQALLSKKTITVIGVGALGTVVSSHLTRAGIGTLRIIDRDYVDKSNLQRQMLFDEVDVDTCTPKVIAAERKLRAINSGVNIISYIQDVNPHTIEDLIVNSDLIIDATDNMATRFLINDASIKHNIPWIYGGAIHSRGMFFTVIPNETPCLQCLFHQSNQQHGETCDTVGVLGPLVHIIAAAQVTEAYKILLGYEAKINRNLCQVDTWDFDYDELPIEYSKNPNCRCCEKKEFTYLEEQLSDIYLSELCGRDSIQITPTNKVQLNLATWERKWRPLGKIHLTPFLLRLYYNKYQLTLFQDGRLLIKGTQDEIEAKNLYSKFIGQ